MTDPDLLQKHHAALTRLLAAQQEIPTGDMRPGQKIAWQMYAAILEDAITTLNSLMEYVNRHME